jgi:hypothetical protein
MSLFNLRDGYFEAYVVWEGALDEERIFPYHLEGAMIRWASQIIQEAREEKASSSVYAVPHVHAYTAEECQCIQYLTDHRPLMEVTGDGR